MDNNTFWINYLEHLNRFDLDRFVRKVQENENIYPAEFKWRLYGMADVYFMYHIEDRIQENEDLLPPVTEQWLQGITNEWGPN